MIGVLKRIGGFFLDIIEAVVTALAIFVIIWLFFFQAHQVKGNSMHPTLENGDYILTDKISYRFKEPERGDIVVFHSPKNRDDYIKRIMGLPGERIEIKNDKIFVNGTPLSEEYLPKVMVTRGGSKWKEGTVQIVPSDSFLVLGDNRTHSSDSREFGAIVKEDIVGKAWLRYWPVIEIGLIEKAKY